MYGGMATAEMEKFESDIAVDTGNDNVGNRDTQLTRSWCPGNPRAIKTICSLNEHLKFSASISLEAEFLPVPIEDATRL